MSGTTQAQIDAVKAWYAQGAPLLNALAPCTVTPPAPSVGQYTEYCNAFLGNKTYYTRSCSDAGVPIAGSTPVVACIVDRSSATSGRVNWGGTAEHHTVRNGWEVWEGAETLSTGVFTPIEQVKCYWDDLVAHTTQDISSILGSGPVGGCMHPLVVPSSGKCRIRQWGWAWANGARSGQFYWEATYDYGQTGTDQCWTQGQQTVQIISMQEAWWDQSPTNGGWTTSRGSAPTPGWINGQPADPVVTYHGWEWMGRGHGLMWQYQFPDYRTALSSAS